MACDVTPSTQAQAPEQTGARGDPDVHRRRVDVHQTQITFDYLDTETGAVITGQIRPPTRLALRRRLAERFAGRGDAATGGGGLHRLALRGRGTRAGRSGGAPGRTSRHRDCVAAYGAFSHRRRETGREVPADGSLVLRVSTSRPLLARAVRRSHLGRWPARSQPGRSRRASRGSGSLCSAARLTPSRSTRPPERRSRPRCALMLVRPRPGDSGQVRPPVDP